MALVILNFFYSYITFFFLSEVCLDGGRAHLSKHSMSYIQTSSLHLNQGYSTTPTIAPHFLVKHCSE